MVKQPEALRLAAEVASIETRGKWDAQTCHQAAAERRRLHALNAKLLSALRIADAFCGSLTSEQCPDSVHIPIRDAIDLAGKD